MHREPEVPEAEAQVGKWIDCRARIISKELAQLQFVKNVILRSACSTSPRVGVDLVKSACTRIARLMNSPAEGPNRMVTKGAVAILKNTRQLGHRFCGRAQTY